MIDGTQITDSVVLQNRDNYNVSLVGVCESWAIIYYFTGIPPGIISYQQWYCDDGIVIFYLTIRGSTRTFMAGPLYTEPGEVNIILYL